jgi:two-component SAPR family response regulator
MAEEQDDIFVLYRDYFRSIGHKVIYSSQIIDDLMANLEKNLPDICILDYKFPKSGNGLDAATKILKQYPAMPILFISTYEHLLKKMETIPFFQDKKFSVLIKPVMLAKIEEEILRLTNIR